VQSDAVQDSGDIRIALDTGTDPGTSAHDLYRVRGWIRAHSRVYALLGDGTRKLREAVGLAEKQAERDARVRDFSTRIPSMGCLLITT
jgi:hypothetical protein